MERASSVGGTNLTQGMFVGSVKGTELADIERREGAIASNVGARSGSRVSFGFFNGECSW
jgi:hypothetical protein